MRGQGVPILLNMNDTLYNPLKIISMRRLRVYIKWQVNIVYFAVLMPNYISYRGGRRASHDLSHDIRSPEGSDSARESFRGGGSLHQSGQWLSLLVQRRTDLAPSQRDD